jgi:hypothetical protein
MNTQHGYDPANYYVWRTPDGFSIHLSLDVVRGLGAQIAASGETCGILLGRSITTPFAATIADDFAVIAPSEDFESARRAAENERGGLRAIGYFRSQRDGQTKLDARDLQTFDRWFYENGNIGLLIRVPRRGDSEAALFYWQDGQPQPREFGFGFPFDATKLAGGHPGWRFPDPLEPTEEAPGRSTVHQSPEAPVVAASEGIRWSRLWPTAALVVIGITTTQLLWNSKKTASADSSAVVAATPASASASETPLGLKATSQPRQLEIGWTPSAPAVAAAVKGTMYISGTGVADAIAFDAPALREGYIAYMPKANDINIRFEVTAADGTTTTESIRVVANP